MEAVRMKQSRTSKYLLAAGLTSMALSVPMTAAAAPQPTQAPTTTVQAKKTNADNGCRRSRKGECMFYNMGGSIFDGKRLGPQIMMVQYSGPPGFGKLLKLKRPQFFKRSLDTAKLPLFR